MRVTELAKTLGVTPDTIRFYTRSGVLRPNKRLDNSYLEYSHKDISRMTFILSAWQLWFSVDDIKLILAEALQKRAPCPTVRGLIDQRLQETEQRFEDMRQLRKRIREAVDEWSSQPDKNPNSESVCHLIENFKIQGGGESLR